MLLKQKIGLQIQYCQELGKKTNAIASNVEPKLSDNYYLRQLTMFARWGWNGLMVNINRGRNWKKIQRDHCTVALYTPWQ